MCKELFDVQACQVLDPTMLLDCADYMKFASRAPKSQGNLMVYVLDRTEEKDAFISEFAEKRGLVPFYANSKAEMPWDVDISARERKQPPLENWLRGFADADFVLTDSFHACVFSILFHKPFGVFVNLERGLSRIESLLRTLGLMDRCIFDAPVDLDRSIDWELIDNVLMQKAESSMEFLKQALNKK